jgi:hypothetical protein
MSTLLHVSLIPIIHNRPSSISYTRVLLGPLLHVSLIPTSYNRPNAYKLQKSATEHSSTCNCINVYTICWMYWYKMEIKWDYRKKLVNCNVVIFHLLILSIKVRLGLTRYSSGTSCTSYLTVLACRWQVPLSPRFELEDPPETPVPRQRLGEYIPVSIDMWQWSISW